ncbi:MAG: T9SS type A sorting domain-containing protein, partial [Bacteroidota bacterium]
QGYQLRYTVTTSGCPETTDEVYISFLLDGTLGLADLLFTGYNSLPADNFSLVVLTDAIPAGQTFSITDNGWLAAGGFRDQEETANYVTCRPLVCGDEIRFEADGNGYAAAGNIVASLQAGTFPQIALTGDQLFLYSGTVAPTAAAGQDLFVAAIQMNCDACTEADWDGDATDGGSSAKPAPFRTTAASLYGGGSPLDNAAFDCSVNVGASPEAKVTALTNPANWLFRDGTAYDLSGCGDFACCTPGEITEVSADVNGICPGETVTITFVGTLNDSDEWLVSSRSCDGDFVTTVTGRTGGNFQVSPTQTTTYFIRAESSGGGCPADLCTEITIMIDGTAPTAVCRDIEVDLDENGAPVFTPEDLDGGSTDNCPGDLNFFVAAIQTQDFTCDNVGLTYTVQLVVSDAAGNTAVCDANVTLVDNTNPTVTCQNIVIDLGTDGTFTDLSSDFIFDNILTSFTDNCAGAPDGTVDISDEIDFDCNNLGTVIPITYFFNDGNGNEASCGITVTVNDPTRACGTPPTVLCQDFADKPDPDGNYLLNANQLDAGSTDDRSVYSLVFGNTTETVGQTTTDNLNFNNIGHGQSFTAGVTGIVQKVRVRFAASSGPHNLHFYNSATGSGTVGGVGTPDYTEVGVMAYASVGGSLTEITLTEPFPVVAGQQYSFVFEGSTHPIYGDLGDPYPGGDFIFNYDLASGCCTFGDMIFEVDIIPPATQLFTTEGSYPLEIYAIDDQGNYSDACNATFNLRCIPGEVTSVTEDVNDICPGETVTITFSGTLNDSEDWVVFSGACDGDLVTTITDPAGGSFQVSPTETTTYYIRAGANTPGQCSATDCTPVTINLESVPPIAMCQDVEVDFDANGDAIFDPADVDAGSTDNCSGELTFIIPQFTLNLLSCDNLGGMLTTQVAVRDVAGNQSTCVVDLTIVDNDGGTAVCQDIVVDLGQDGVFTDLSANFIFDNILVSYSDNCAEEPAGTVDISDEIDFDCDDLGAVIPITYSFRDGNGNGASCTINVTVNDPLGVCGTPPTVACTDFSAGPDPDGSYVLDANDLDDGSTDDRSVYSLVFTDETETVGQTTLANRNFRNVGHGQSFTAGITGVVQKIKVRFFTSTGPHNLHLYNSATGSGAAGSIGTPAYTEPSVNTYASVDGSLTEITLTEPFPVVAGQQYSFVFEGITHPFYGDLGGPYPGGDFIFNYDLSSGCCPAADMVFEVDIIGPTTQEFSGDDVYPVTVYAVDDQGNLSDPCNADFTLDQALPVEWLSFGADAGAKTVDLSWETSNNPVNEGFHVERSPDGLNWAVIGRITPHVGPQHYAFPDQSPLGGSSYYRIRQTDFDGTLTYSPVAEVFFTGEIELGISPNPATDLLQIRVPAGTAVEMYDLHGRVVDVTFRSVDESGQFSAKVDGLPRGAYVLRFRFTDGEVTGRRVVLQ